MDKQQSPSAERNKEPIWQVLKDRILQLQQRYKPPTHAAVSANDGSDVLHILEIAAGAGVHTCHFAQKLRQASWCNFRWYPTDPMQDALESQRAYIMEVEGLIEDFVNMPLPLTLGTNGIVESETAAKLDSVTFDLIVNINMIHISPWEATLGLMKVAGEKLKRGGQLYIYGPYRVGGSCVESNRRFDEWLKSKDPGYGVRNLEDVLEVGKAAQLELVETIEMPANNLSVILRKL